MTATLVDPEAARGTLLRNADSLDVSLPLLARRRVALHQASQVPLAAMLERCCGWARIR